MSHLVYAGFTVLWCIKLQTENALSTKEADYIVFIQVMHNVIPFMVIMVEILFIFVIHLRKTEVFC